MATSPSATCMELEEEDEHGIRATFVKETVTYYINSKPFSHCCAGSGNDHHQEHQREGPREGEPLEDAECWQPLTVPVWCATTTRGGALTSDDHDATGILIWPATHLLCQHLVQRSDLLVDDQAVVELGCGVGLAGVTALRSTTVQLWVSSDVDERSLNFCRENYQLNGFEVSDMMDDPSPSRAWVETLAWGDAERATQVLERLKARTGKVRFDAVVGSDIVYPSTSGPALQQLFESVDQLLRPDGTFWLSFATRDGIRTPLRLLEAASRAGFAVDRADPLPLSLIQRLPPLLDSVLLRLHRDASAATNHNALLGGPMCHIFPRLRDTQRRLNEELSSDEEWDAPFAEDSSTEAP